jgi:hypothetical protein
MRVQHGRLETRGSGGTLAGLHRRRATFLGPLVRLCAGALVGTALAACGRTMVQSPLDTAYRPGDGEADLRFWHTLPVHSAVSNDEGLHGLFLLADGTDARRDYEGRLVDAKERGWLRQSFNEPADMAMRRATLARALCVVCQVKGGVMMHVVGPAPRYALRELIHLEIMPPSSEMQVISGLEYLGIISRAQDYRTFAAARAAGEKAAGP